MAAAADFYRELLADGFSVTADDNRVVIRPRSRITEPLRQRIREAKPDLLELIARETQTAATPATVTVQTAPSVATVATVAVAEPRSEK